jgi:signal transduction histidine kinase/DNA-binding response OmpR family regulator
MPIITYDSHVRLHNLSPGKYTLIASSNIGSTWSEPKPLLHIIVTPPWWDSTWVILGIIALILLIFFLVHKWIIYRKNQSMAQTMLEHDREMQEDRVLFLTNINHELRTPLTLIHAPIKQMLDHGQLSADVRRQLTRVYKHTKQMRNIINMVLDMRKMESVDSALNIANQALNDWLAAIAEDYSYEFAEKQITLATSFDETVGSVQYDPKRMETVVTNILINAFKFSTPGTTVTLATKRVDDRVRIEISDEGIGINEEDIEHLFTCFFQGRNHSMPGTGLGLPYAKRLVELHHGIIGAYNNTTGRGATFFFELPIEQPEGATADKAAIRFSETYEDSTTIILSPDDFSTMAGRSILVVEDEPEMRDYLADLLRPKFAKVYTADNGADALILIKQHLPDIVISDIMMARVNGLQLCQQVKSDNDLSHIPFVLLTAKTDSDSIMTGYKAGADAYLEKPFDPDYLLARLSALLRNKTNMKEHYKNYKTAADESTPMPHSNTDEQFILRLNNIIESQLDNCDLDVKFITDTMGIGRATLYTRMKQLLGVGVNDYINRYRIAKARDLLLTTNLSVQEIATMCGFSNQRYFSTVFKQAKGFAPTHYRERFASNPEDAA